jgi:hypothetical protein
MHTTFGIMLKFKELAYKILYRSGSLGYGKEELYTVRYFFSKQQGTHTKYKFA